MANINCDACEDLRQEVPSLITNGLSSTMCASLKNDTGLKASSDNDDCEDLNNMNDCLVGNMEAEVEKHDVCDWKEFMKKFIPNVWTTLKAMICAICGIWTNIHNLWTFAKSYQLSKDGDYIVLTAQDGNHGRVLDKDTWQANTKTQNGYVTAGNGNENMLWATDASGNPAWRAKAVIDGKAFVRYFRDLGAGDSVPYLNNVDTDTRSVLNIYMDSHGSVSGSQEADRDYVVIIQNCTNYKNFNELHGYVTYYSSGEDDSTVAKRQALRAHKAQHPVIFLPAARRVYNNGTADETIGWTKMYFANYSWTTSGAVLIKKGQHVKVEFYCSGSNVPSDILAEDSNAPEVRLHQFVLTWIPVSVDAISPDE